MCRVVRTDPSDRDEMYVIINSNGLKAVFFEAYYMQDVLSNWIVKASTHHVAMRHLLVF